jgi:hypothetical protein
METSAAPRIGVPPLAGICTLKDAARPGYSVDQNVSRLLRYHWVLRRLGEHLITRIPGTPEWEVKCGFSYQQWLDGEHADGLRRRISELRSPAPRLDVAPASGLEAFVHELGAAADSAELLSGVCKVARPALIATLEQHLDRTNPLVDQPTCRLLRIIIAEQQQAVQWGVQALAALAAGDEAADRVRRWKDHLQHYLDAAGGIAGDSAPGTGAVPPPRVRDTQHDTIPRRDSRFQHSYDFDFPPHTVYNSAKASAAERNLALLCKRLLEMDVPEMMASFLMEDTEMPWEHHLAYRRQLWDEARHAMMGEAAFEAAGIDWTKIPLNVGFSLRLNRHANARERELMLYAIEQSLMPSETGKRFEYETAVEAGDALSATYHDYDWADEVLHAQTGRRWLRLAGLLGPDYMDVARAVHARTWRELDRYRTHTNGVNWWRTFVRQVLGFESALTEEDLGIPQILPTE